MKGRCFIWKSSLSIAHCRAAARDLAGAEPGHDHLERLERLRTLGVDVPASGSGRASSRSSPRPSAGCRASSGWSASSSSALDAELRHPPVGAVAAAPPCRRRWRRTAPPPPRAERRASRLVPGTRASARTGPGGRPQPPRAADGSWSASSALRRGSSAGRPAPCRSGAPWLSSGLRHRHHAGAHRLLDVPIESRSESSAGGSCEALRRAGGRPDRAPPPSAAISRAEASARDAGSGLGQRHVSGRGWPAHHRRIAAAGSAVGTAPGR